MARSPRQMVAIIMALKKKGLLGRLAGLGTAVAKPPAAFSASPMGKAVQKLLKSPPKQFPIRVSSTVRLRRPELAAAFTPERLSEITSLIPESHRRAMSIKGIYAVSEHEFHRTLGGILRRTASSPEAIHEATEAFSEIRKLSPGAKVLGAHSKGRVFLNVDAFKPTLEGLKGFGDTFSPEEITRILGGQVKGVLLHELGHNFDSPKLGYMVARDVPSRVGGKQRKNFLSQNPDFMRKLGIKSRAYRSPAEEGQARAAAAEGFAGLYANYLVDRDMLAAVNPKMFEAIRPFFEGK